MQQKLNWISKKYWDFLSVLYSDGYRKLECIKVENTLRMQLRIQVKGKDKVKNTVLNKS